MKIFKYWVAEKTQVDISGELKVITSYGGSNLSLDDASLRAREKLEKIKRKIYGDRNVFEDYEVEIREEILQVVDEKTIITRNRYGAQVMNAENLMFLDIDKPKSTLGGLFKKSSPAGDKENIFDMVRKLAETKYGQFGFRLYETYQGARVIVTGSAFDARDNSTLAIMKDFNTDPLYASICRKQGCFRARLTPKPYRMKLKAYKVKYPREETDIQFDNWLQTYEQASRNFSVCKLVGVVGSGSSESEAVSLHDEMTGAGLHLPLA